MGSAAELAKVGCKYLGTPYETKDCQAFVEACLKDIGINKDLPGSNAWLRIMTWYGTPEECKRKFGEIPKGAFLYILEKDGKEPAKYQGDGIGNASHIGIKTGMTGRQMVELGSAQGGKRVADTLNKGDGAIHSSASRGHVVTSTFKDKTIRGGWNCVGLWDKLDYGEKINQILREGKPPEQDVTERDEPMGEGVVFAPTGTTVKMRYRPSTGCGTYWDVPIGEKVTILRRGDWDRIVWNGMAGYMRSEFIKEDESMATIEPEQMTIQLAKVYAPEGNTVKMRYKPSTDCALFERVPIGTTVAVNKRGEHWTQISVGNRSGWYMMTKFLKFEED